MAVGKQVVNKKTGQTRDILPEGQKALDKVINAYIKQQYDGYLAKHKGPGGKVACAVNGRPLGRAFEDPQTGGYRNYLLHEQLFVVCCKSCMSDIRTDFNIQLGALAMMSGKKAEDFSPLKDFRRLPPPPTD